MNRKTPSDEPGEVGPINPDPAKPIEDEPVTIGTLFILIVFLMALAALWAIMYLRLIER